MFDQLTKEGEIRNYWVSVANMEEALITNEYPDTSGVSQLLSKINTFSETPLLASDVEKGMIFIINT